MEETVHSPSAIKPDCGLTLAPPAVDDIALTQEQFTAAD
jgi:hypothetical protein